MKFKLWLENDLAGTKVVDKHGNPKRVFHGSPRIFDKFKMGATRSTGHEAGSIGIWFTDDPLVAQGFAHKEGEVEYYVKKSDPTWSDGSEKHYARDTHLYGKVHSVYLDIKTPKIYAGKDGFEELMDDRDNFTEYISGSKGKAIVALNPPDLKPWQIHPPHEPGYWRKRYVAVERERANKMFVDYLKSQGHDGIIIQNTRWDKGPGRPTNRKNITTINI